ncbi:MAG: Xaa-Pro peptidase family protein [Desulfoprunum sp.]|jgi:Xaa-Pro aminopeptidase|uniref:M24 family metallopeptidase n=1 Tax=Desulfoprunum sp. TaxID=2020866 RepID=UPI00052CB412|nr:peptidase M24 [Desulfobulbus sp. Tol-SR]
MDYSRRVEKLQAILRRQKMDALLVTQPENRRYLSGYTGSDHGIGETSGVLLVPARGGIFLLTDFRYRIQAEQDVPWATVLLYPRGLLLLLPRLLEDLGIRKLAFESHYMLHSTAAMLAQALAKVGITTTPLKGLVEKMRLIKDEAEIDCIRRSVQLNEEVFGEVFPSIQPGQTEIEIALAIETTMRRKGAEQPSFSSIVASADRSALPHAVPGGLPVEKNRPLTIDMGLVLNGYCSDMTRTFVPGRADARYLELHRLVRRAQLAGMQAIRAGVKAGEVDRAARAVIAGAGYGDAFGHALGHGVGLAVHEDPRLSSLNHKQLRAGMVVTVEPGVYIAGWGGIRLENMVVVREEGCENLNSDTTWLDL